MADLGSLNVKFQIEGLQAILEGLKSIATSTAKTEKATKSAQKAMHEAAEQAVKDNKIMEGSLETRANKEVSVAQATENKLERIREAKYRNVQKWAEKEVQADKSAAEKMVRQRQSTWNKYVGAPVGLGINRGMQMAGYAVQGAAAGMLFKAGEQAFTTRQLAGQVAIAMNAPGNNDKMTWRQAEEQAKATANELGVSPEEALKGTLAIARHGAPALAKRWGGKVTMLSKAENLEASDLGDLLQTLQRQNPLSDKDQLDPKKVKDYDDMLQRQLYTIIGQGKEFNLPIAEVAKMAGKATGVSKAFSSSATMAGEAVLQTQLLGMAQIAREGGAATPQDAMKSVNSFFLDLQGAARSPKRLAKSGLKQSDIVDKSGSLLDPNTLITNLFKSTGGNIMKMEGVVNRSGLKFLEGLVGPYRQGGIPAVQEALRTHETATVGEGIVKQDLDIWKESNEVQRTLQTSTNKLADAIEKNFPIIVNALQTLSPIMSSLPAMLATAIGGGGVMAGAGRAVGSVVQSGLTAAGVASGVAPGVATAGVAAELLLLTSLGHEVWKLHDEVHPVTRKEALSGTAAQFAPNKYDKDKAETIGDSIISSLGGIAVKLAAVAGAFGDDKHTTGPKGPNLPGANK